MPAVTGRVRNFGREAVRLLQPTVFACPAGYVVAEVRDAATGEPILPLGECGTSAGGPPPDEAFFSIPPGKTAALDLENVLRGYWEPLHTGRFVVGRRYRLTLRYVTRPTLRPSHGFGVEPTVPPAIRERVEALTPCDLTSNAVEFTMAPSRPVVP
jgi:hypothetical protein